MADVATDLAMLLDAGSAIAAGVDLFTNDMPDSPDAITVLYTTPGGPPIETLGADSLPAVIAPRVQIQTRGPHGPGGHDVALTRAREAYNLLVMITNETVNGADYHRVAPLQEPFFLRRDENERPYFAFNVQVFRVAE